MGGEVGVSVRMLHVTRIAGQPDGMGCNALKD
jgi:hypothetical protein